MAQESRITGGKGERERRRGREDERERERSRGRERGTEEREIPTRPRVCQLEHYYTPSGIREEENAQTTAFLLRSLSLSLFCVSLSLFLSLLGISFFPTTVHSFRAISVPSPCFRPDSTTQHQPTSSSSSSPPLFLHGRTSVLTSANSRGGRLAAQTPPTNAFSLGADEMADEKTFSTLREQRREKTRRQSGGSAEATPPRANCDARFPTNRGSLLPLRPLHRASFDNSRIIKKRKKGNLFEGERFLAILVYLEEEKKLDNGLGY